MELKYFIEKFVCKNTLIRLWTSIKGGYQMIAEGDRTLCMEWELLQDKVWQSKYANCEVIGIKDIVVDDAYIEAVNIVIIINK